jgi:hypothetical protein
VKADVRPRRLTCRLRLNHLPPPVTHPPPAPSSALRALYRATGPPRLKGALTWVRASAHACTIAGLAQAFLKASDAHAIERSLRAGDHEEAAKRFCERFSERQFPLEYAYTGRCELIVEIAGGIQHEGYGENWEEMGDLWSLKPAFLLSWALMEDPYGDELMEDDDPEEEQGSHYRICDEAREAIAELAELPIQALFDGVPADGFPADHLRSRFTGTCWEPLLWAAPWLWRMSGNPFLDRDGDDYPEPEPWSASSVLRLNAEFREALRIMRAVDGFNRWLLQASGERAKAAVLAALGPSSDRISTLLDLPVPERHCPSNTAPAS